MQFKEPKVLWKTDVGSWMWNMNRPDSDHDWYIGYQFDSRSFLLGNQHIRGHQSHTETEDKASYEIGVIVRQLLDGNANHLWGVLSQNIEISSPELVDLVSIVKNHPAKNCYRSIHGMTIHNLHDYFDSVTSKQRVQTKMHEDRQFYLKKVNMVARGLEFGIRILEGKGYSFEPTHYETRSELDTLLKDLNTAFENSKLPAKPDPEPFEQYLLRLRLKNLEEF